MLTIESNNNEENNSHRNFKIYFFYFNLFNKIFFRKSKVSSDSLSELAELVSRGDEKGLFRTCLPASIEQMVKSENLEFCKNRTVYDNEYFQFIYEMVKISKVIINDS